MSTIIMLTHSANRESVQSLHLSRRGVGQARRARQPVTLGYGCNSPLQQSRRVKKEGDRTTPAQSPEGMAIPFTANISFSRAVITS